MRCLEKDAGKRYQSARELSADLQRYLRDEPVVARPRRLLYAFRKFTKRHRIVFATGAAVIVVLLTTSVLTSWLALRATRRKSAHRERNYVSGRKICWCKTRFATRATLMFDYRPRSIASRRNERRTPSLGEPMVEASIRSMLGSAYDSLSFETSVRRPQFEQSACNLSRLNYGLQGSSHARQKWSSVMASRREAGPLRRSRAI